MALRNQHIAPKPKYVKIDRVLQKEQRMDMEMDIIDKEKRIMDYQLQDILGWGDGIFYSISKAILQKYPNSYARVKGEWKVKDVSEPSSIMWDNSGTI